MNLLKLFPKPNEIREGLRVSGQFYLFNMNAGEKVDPSVQAAWRSFSVYWLTAPFGLLSGWIFDRVYIAAYGVDKPLYFAYAVTGSIASTFLAMFLSYKLSRMEHVEANFPRYVTAINWGSLWVLIISIPLIGLVQSGWLSHDQIAYLGTGLFLISLVYGWFFAWRALQLEVTVAMGVAILASAIPGIVSDFIGLRLYGVARPFFEQ